jgi:hypothetical protein
MPETVMLIFRRELWGPVAGVATALLLVLALSMGSDLQNSAQGHTAAQVAAVGFAHAH